MTYDPLGGSVPRDKGISPSDIISYKLGAVKVYKGSMLVTDASGWATAVVAASRPFIGVALETVDNSAGAAGALDMKVMTTGVHNFYILSGETFVQGDVGSEVYWHDGSAGSSVTVSKSAQGLGAKVGRITKYISATECEVDISGYANTVTGQAS